MDRKGISLAKSVETSSHGTGASATQSVVLPHNLKCPRTLALIGGNFTRTTADHPGLWRTTVILRGFCLMRRRAARHGRESSVTSKSRRMVALIVCNACVVAPSRKQRDKMIKPFKRARKRR